jgi:transcriptional regulator with XRE-family HTH domain
MRPPIDPDLPAPFEPAALRLRRLARGWRLVDLVDRLHRRGVETSITTVHAWESGIRKPSRRSVRALAGVFGCRQADFCEVPKL